MDMSTMQKHSILRGLILILAMGYFIANGQINNLYQLYTTGHFFEIEKLSREGNITNPEWAQFARILFIEDLDLALSAYISLYKDTADEQLRRLITDRVSQYYYAKGLYDSAERILKDQDFRARLFSINMEKIAFGVQLGAYSSHQNAQNAKNKYLDKIDNLSIIKKSSGGKELFALIAGKFSDKASAEQLRVQIQNNFRIKGIVIQY